VANLRSANCGVASSATFPIVLLPSAFLFQITCHIRNVIYFVTVENIATKFIDPPVQPYKCSAEMTLAAVVNLLESVGWIASLFQQWKLMAHFQKTNDGRFVSLHYGNALFKALHLRTTCIAGGFSNSGGKGSQQHFCVLNLGS
jgi:hypothetical protein